MSGHTVIIAHIERYNCLRKDISNVEYYGKWELIFR